MPPGAQIPVQGTTTRTMTTTTMSNLDELHKRMQQTEGNASSIERQLNDVRSHLKTLREHVSLEGSSVKNLDLESMVMANQQQHQQQQQDQDHQQQDQDHHHHQQQQQQQDVSSVLEGVEGEIGKVKYKVDQVQTELQISWMSLTTLQFQLKAKQQAAVQPHSQQQMQARLESLQEQLERKSRVLEHISGSYERLRHSFLDKEEELRYEKQLVSNTLKALSVTHRDADLKLVSVNQEAAKVTNLAMELREWCAITDMKAEEQCIELKQLRTELASIATNLLHIFDPDVQQQQFQQQRSCSSRVATPPQPIDARQQQQQKDVPGSSSDNMFRQMSTRIEVLVQELKSERVEQDKVIDSLLSSPGAKIHQAEQPESSTALESAASRMSLAGGGGVVGKRKLSEAFQVGFGIQQQVDVKPSAGEMAEREKEFLMQKKAFLSSLRESFQRVRQREIVCATMDRRLLKARLLLEQAQRGCVSSDYVAMRSKRQIEQAYRELIHVQGDIDSIKALSLEQHELVHSDQHHHRGGGVLPNPPPPPQPPRPAEAVLAGTPCEVIKSVMRSSDMVRLKSELVKQVELNMKLKQQVARSCLQAERAEGIVAVERLEVDKLRQQVQGISEKLKQEARCLNDSHLAALRAKDFTIFRLREQLQSDEQRKILQEELNAALESNEELSMEKERLLAKLGGQDLDLLKLRNQNVCLVVEKIAFEGSARALQEKMSSLMAKLSQTKQHWKRFIVYCETF